MNAVDTEFVAFVDSDCEVGDRWLQSLLGHFRDPAVGMVAPRIVADSRVGNAIGSYERMRSALDMGTTPELVTPGGRMSYVPSAALVARREALGGGFDETMRVGEDVDLVRRMVDAGWQVRYDPSVIVHHRVRASRHLKTRARVFTQCGLPGLSFGGKAACGTSCSGCPWIVARVELPVSSVSTRGYGPAVDSKHVLRCHRSRFAFAQGVVAGRSDRDCLGTSVEGRTGCQRHHARPRGGRSN